MATGLTISEDIHRRVGALVDAEGVTQAEAIRRVAAEMGRTPSSTSSAFYAGKRAAEARDADADERSGGGRRQARSGPRHHRQLFAEMLPLVEAGASAAQAARRFGQDEDIEAIAAGFEEWRRGMDDTAGSRDAPRLRLDDAEARIASLEAENRVLRARPRTRQAGARAPSRHHRRRRGLIPVSR